jgi:DNA helicase-2/ATP-dependent DNA helicase PcrA
MEFNEQQKAAINCSARNILVLAGAGTGKTRTIIGRAVRLVQDGCPPNRIAIITFTRRAAAEIRHRLIKTAGDSCRHVMSGTFHNFCLREMNTHPDWFGLTGSTILDRDDQSQLMKLSRGELIAEKSKDNPLTSSALKSQIPQAAKLLNYYSFARNTNQPIKDYLEKYAEETEQVVAKILQIFAAYKKRKIDSGYLDFDDILHRFAKVMRQEAQICSRISGGYDHVLVDEMQDTNPLQWLILESMAPYLNLFCVGDDAQSIYAFRGADFRNVHSFQERLPEAEVLKLELNYRSTQEILDLSNWLLNQSTLKYNKQLSAYRGPGIRPKLAEFYGDREEAEWVGEQLSQHHARQIRWDEQMVLCRTSNSARVIESELIRRKIPYRFIGGIGLLQTAHVKDLLSVLRVVVNHRDELSWVRYLTMWSGIGEVTAAKLIRFMGTASNFPSALELLSQSRPGNPLLEPLQEAHQLQDAPQACIKRLIDSLDVVMETRYDNWERRRRDVKLLLRLADKHENIKDFLDTYTLDPISTTEADADIEDDILTLITVHSAKGTEAKVCYVVAAQQGNYPHVRSLSDPDAVEEERRILYVALTRAQDELLISRNLPASIPYSVGSLSPSHPSFFSTLPRELVDPVQASVESWNSLPKNASYWDDDYID